MRATADDLGTQCDARPRCWSFSARWRPLRCRTRPLDVGAVTLVALAAAALAWRRDAPVVVLGVTVVLMTGYLVVGYAYGPIQLCMGGCRAGR